MLGVGVGAGQDRHHRQGQRQLAVVRAGKVEAHRPVVRRFDALDEAVGGALLRTAFRLQEIEGEEDVGRGDRRAVGKMRRRVEVEDDLVARRVGLEALGDEAVERERLVVGAGHQRLIDVADEALRGRQGLDVVGVQAVERAEIGEVEPAAFGRVGVDVGEMR